jgi:hypothetical protein
MLAHYKTNYQNEEESYNLVRMLEDFYNTSWVNREIVTLGDGSDSVKEERSALFDFPTASVHIS